MIQFEHVDFSYEQGVSVLEDLNITLEDGEAVGLIGANGAGKSTLMKLMLGLENCTSGRILVDGMTVEKKNLKEIRRRLGVVLQNSDNQMFMPTVFEDLVFAPRNYGMTKEEAEQKADAVLAQLGITDLKYRQNHKLSGGEKRMAAIAAVLAMDPATVLMDEPTSALDPYHRRIVIRAMNAMERGKIIASHDLDMILDTCSRVILLSGGRIAADGPAEEILRDRELLEANRMELPLRWAER